VIGAKELQFAAGLPRASGTEDVTCGVQQVAIAVCRAVGRVVMWFFGRRLRPSWLGDPRNRVPFLGVINEVQWALGEGVVAVRRASRRNETCVLGVTWSRVDVVEKEKSERFC
jgi:hypothetical protein